MPTCVKMTVISLCVLLCSILASLKGDSGVDSARSSLMQEVGNLQDEINRIMKGHITSPNSPDDSFVHLESCPVHSSLSEDRVVRVACGPGCMEKGGELLKKSWEPNTGLTLHVHGTEDVLSTSDPNFSGQGVPGENSLVFTDDSMASWGWSYEERRRFEGTANEDTCILYAGGANLWIGNPPIIKLSLSNPNPSHHIIILRDKFRPLYTTHLKIIGKTEQLARESFDGCPMTTFFVKQYTNKRPFSVSMDEFAIFRKLNLDVLVTRLWEYKHIVRCITKHICLDNRTIELSTMNMHFWIPISWLEFEALCQRFHTPQKIKVHMKMLSMQDKLAVHYAVCPKVQGVPSDSNALEMQATTKSLNMFSRTYAEKSYRSKYSDERAMDIYQLLSVHYGNDRKLMDKLFNQLFQPLPFD
eukprot:GHVH01010958.1.p1 GENE.GHVH01010958.1~~GHVH01010958.1.p1  ORF type:complete len:415 (+),score=32.07 GHVH01010958.1:952-2196(+)